MAAAFEAISLARKAGVRIPMLLDIVKQSTGDSYFVRNLDNFVKLVKEHPHVREAGSKDLEYALDFGKRVGLNLPLARLVLQQDLVASFSSAAQ